jgi:hypothetical protein
MKSLYLEVDESVYKEFIGFLNLVPKNKIKISKENPLFSGIPYVSEKEQKEIEKLISKKDCKTISHTKKIKI